MTPLQLAEKLLLTLHLNVQERAVLPGGRMPFSVLVQAAQQILDQDRFMPPLLRPAEDFTGVLLEVRGDQLLVHERHEIGVARFSPIASRRAADLPSAVSEFIAKNGGDNIDGVKISFDT